MAFAPRCDISSRLSPTVATNSWTVAPFPAANPSFAFQSAVVEAIVQLSMDGWEGLRIVTTPFQERSSESLARPQLPQLPGPRIFQDRFQAALHNHHGMRSPPVR